MDELCAHLDISRSYCLNCGSWKTLPLSKLNVCVDLLGEEVSRFMRGVPSVQLDPLPNYHDISVDIPWVQYVWLRLEVR